MVLIPPGVEAALCVMHWGLWSLGWAAGKQGWSGLCQTSRPIVGSPAMAVRECVGKWWVLVFSAEAKSWIMFSDLVNVQGYLRPDIIFGVKPLSFVNTYQPPSFPAHETVCPESGLPMVR